MKLRYLIDVYLDNFSNSLPLLRLLNSFREVYSYLPERCPNSLSPIFFNSFLNIIKSIILFYTKLYTYTFPPFKYVYTLQKPFSHPVPLYQSVRVSRWFSYTSGLEVCYCNLQLPRLYFHSQTWFRYFCNFPFLQLVQFFYNNLLFLLNSGS